MPRRAQLAAPAIERLDRYVLVTTPKAPLVAWARRVAAPEGAADEDRASPASLTLDEARAYHRTAYLVPFAENAHDVESWVEENHDLVFEQELHAFTSNRRRWPRNRTFEAFLDWFDLELLDAPIDLVDAPLVGPRHPPGKRG